MEYDYADQLDLEWQSLINRYFNEFSCQNNGTNNFTYEQVLEKVFCPADIEIEQETNYKDKELSEKCLIECHRFLSNRRTPPRETQIHFLLQVAKYTSKDETCFISLNTNNIFSNVLYMSQPTSSTTGKITKILFLDFLYSCLEHQSGVKVLLETRCWMHAYKLILDYQNMDQDITNSGYKILTKLLEQAAALNKDFCYQIIQFLSEPLLNSAQIIDQAQCTTVKRFELIEKLKPSVLCLLEILERLLEEYSATVLNCIMHLEVDLASDAVSKTTTDKSVCLILDRIALILSFFKLTDIFDGIKSMSEDPLAVTGFLRIMTTELDKGAPDIVFELYYHSLRYLKHISERLPTCVLKGKNFDIKTEIVCLQLEPIHLISTKLGYMKMREEMVTDIVRISHITQVLKNLSWNTLKLGQKIKDVLPRCPFNIYTESVKQVIESRHLYSKEHLGVCFEALVYSLKDTMEHLKVRSMSEEEEAALYGYISELLRAILLFIESFNLNWSDSVKILELAQILNGGSCYQWPATIVVQCLNLLQELISRRLSPSMSLLIDCEEELNEFGPFLYQKCFTPEWEVRQAVLSLVHTIAVSANKSFPSFRNLIINAQLPHLISTMALNDENHMVRASAFKCLHEMIMIEDMEEILPKNLFISKVLDVLVSDVAEIAKREAVRLVKLIYQHPDRLEDRVLNKVFKYLEHVALTNPDSGVQVAALEFWSSVVEKNLLHQGWMDRKFPSVTFSKRIVSMTQDEIRKRIYKILQELSGIGCLNVYLKLSNFPNLPAEANEFLKSKMRCFNKLFRDYEVTPENMIFDSDTRRPLNNSSILPSPYAFIASDSADQILHDIFNDTTMKEVPNDLDLVQDEDLYSLIDAKYFRKGFNQPQEAPTLEPIISQADHETTPSHFVDFIYKRVSYFSHHDQGSSENKDETRHTDLANIIDY